MENDQNYSRSYGDSKSGTGFSESVDDAILMDDNSRVDDTQEGSCIDGVITRANVDDAVLYNETRPVFDAAVYVQQTELLESPTLNIEEEANASRKQYPFNTRALIKEATTYELESFDKHALVIFNHKKVCGQVPRHGTAKDVDSLTRTFENFGFEVTAHNDLTKDALFEEIKKFSEQDFTDYGCVAVAILTHCSNNGMLRAKDQLYSEIEVINQFRDYSKPTLVTKPKIFIIQACRGDKVPGQFRKDLDDKDSELFYILPLESDLLIFHSSYAGSVSHRDEQNGSWIIQTLCKKIDTLSFTHDFESIITEVKGNVAIDKQNQVYDQRGLEKDVNKQMPVMTSTLIRKLYLKKFGEGAFEDTYVDRSRGRSDSSHQVMDAVSSSPMTPLLDQCSGPCSSILENFTHMRNSLRYFVAENPNDETAQDILDLANTYEDSDGFNKSKDKMCNVISKHLMDKAQDGQNHKYLHFNTVERKVTKSLNAQNELSLKSSFSSLDICLSGIFVATFVFVLRNVKSN